MLLLKKCVACVMLVSLVVLGGALITPAPAHGQFIAPVRVANTPLPVSGSLNATVIGNVNATVVGTPTVLAQQSGPWSMGINPNNSATPLFVRDVSSRPILVHDGRAFDLLPDPNIAFEFSVPPDVVLTDVHLSLTSTPSVVAVFVAEANSSKTYVYQTVGSPSSTFAASNDGHATIHFQSGLQSAIGLRIGLVCNAIGGNSCAGALMWSGYQP